LASRTARLFLVLAWLLNVAERHELLQDGLGGGGVHAQVGRMHATFARHLFPAWNALHLWRLFESLRQDPAVHVLAHRQTKQRQDRRRDVEQRGPVDPLVFLDVRTATSKRRYW
jgi:hypothetical protein